MNIQKIDKFLKSIFNFKNLILFITYNTFIFSAGFLISKSKYSAYAKDHPAYYEMIVFIQNSEEIKNKIGNIKEIKYKDFSISFDENFNYIDYTFLLIGEKADAKLFSRTKSKRLKWEIERIKLKIKDEEIYVK